MHFARQSGNIIKTRVAIEEYCVCGKEKWKRKVAKIDSEALLISIIHYIG